MSVQAFVLTVILIVSLIVQFLLAAGFVRRLKRSRQPLISDATAPSAVVILCLRGGDPFLAKCIEGLVTQDYPRFRVCFFIDHEQDPSVATLRSALAQHTFNNYDVKMLSNPLATCSLKCSCLIQAINALDDSVKFVALLDADTIPHRTWLRELATALVPDEVGAATGNRWYMPEQYTTGAMIRYLWNAAAVVQMYFYQIAWGGTLAIKMDSIKRANLLDRWRKSLCEDTMLRQQLASIGQQVSFVPSLMMVNREDCTLGSFVDWVQRQLLTARLYHPLWIAVVGHGILTAVLLVWGWIVVILCFMNLDWIYGMVLGLTLVGYRASMLCMAPWMEAAVARLVRERGEATDWQTGLKLTRLAWLVFLTQWVYTWALVRCLFIRSVEWRGISYRIQGPWKIQMLGYRRYSAGGCDNSKHSL
jgi:cellulose synthase/poly-beta-1,6-N-acetylglucosamine synthase-like glycosyltransferase